MDQAAFEVVGREGKWQWQLRDGGTHIAHGATAYDTPGAARERITDVRAYVSRVSDTSFETDEPVTTDSIEFRILRRGELYLWELRVDGDTVAVPPATYQSRDVAQNTVERVKELAVGAVPVLFAGSDEATEHRPFVIGDFDLKQSLASLIGRGPRHRRCLEGLDERIVVMGIRGKSSTTRRIGDVFDRRGYDTLVKITGNRPHLLHNGEHIPIKRRGRRVTLYENIKTSWNFIPVLNSYTPEGIGIFENQGITEYTTRIFNQRFVQPDVILLTNVRQDHQDTLGKTRQDIARSFARSVPDGTHVVSGEQHPKLHEYLQREVEKVGGTLEQVDVPGDHATLIGAETVHGVNQLLEYFDMDPLPGDEVEAYLDAIQPQWTRLPDGAMIFNAAEVNDIESTEAARRSLAGEDVITPFVYLRADRRSRTASFANYVNTLIERGLVETVFVGGDYTSAFARKVNAPVTQYGPDADAGLVLDALVRTGLPIVLMGNTVADFMRRFEMEIERRATQAVHEESDVCPVHAGEAEPEPQ